jgi:pimeloyl-ACP methyl ester carboxylesterase
LTRAPVVLVHGLTASVDWWRPVIAALEPEYEVHVVRLPGFRYADAAEWLRDWLAEHELGGASVVGHSMGGTISILAAAQAPDLVGRLALIAPAGVFATRSRRTYVMPLARSVGLGPRRLIRLARDTLRAGPLRLWQVANDLLSADLIETLQAVRAPTLILWGDNDRLLPPTLGAVFEREIPTSRLVVLDRCGHVPMVEAPEQLNAELLRFLEEGAHEPG